MTEISMEDALERMYDGVSRLDLLKLIYSIKEELWHSCIYDESENIVKRPIAPGSKETVDTFIVNANLIDAIYENCRKGTNLWDDEYPTGA